MPASRSVTTPVVAGSTTANSSGGGEYMTKDDASWILANAFLILTMQSGFGLLEAGCVSFKNVANIMVKNVVDVTIGGMVYWSLGYGMSFGKPSNWFCGLGDFFFTRTELDADMGSAYVHYVFQFSFATAATTIVSGAVAERMKLNGYMLFSAMNIFVYCFPASWAWNDTGWLRNMGFFDFAGGCVVHCTGGFSALVAAKMLGPRMGRFDPAHRQEFGLSSPVTALTGTFMLWWAWLAFNCGSTFGVTGDLWKMAAKTGVVTLNGSIGGGLTGLFLSYLAHRTYDVAYIVTSVLGGLVGVTAGCPVFSPTESIFVGAVGAALAIGTTHVMELWPFEVDDPVGAVPVHMAAAAWGVLAIGIFGENDFDSLNGRSGLVHGGGWQVLGVQTLGLLAIGFWSMTVTMLIFILLRFLNLMRMPMEEELLGADWTEHKVRSETFAVRLERAIQALNLPDEHVDHMMRVMIQEFNSANQDLTVKKGLRKHDQKAALNGTVSTSAGSLMKEEVLPAVDTPPMPHARDARGRATGKAAIALDVAEVAGDSKGGSTRIRQRARWRPMRRRLTLAEEAGPPRLFPAPGAGQHQPAAGDGPTFVRKYRNSPTVVPLDVVDLEADGTLAAKINKHMTAY